MFQRISEKVSGDGSKLGNKGKFLCKLYQAGFLVPDGIILDSDIYFEFLELNNITDKIRTLLKALNRENLQKTSTVINELFDNVEFPKALKQSLEKELDLSKKYAIRSSGTKEDLDDYSFAGQ